MERRVEKQPLAADIFGAARTTERSSCGRTAADAA